MSTLGTTTRSIQAYINQFRLEKKRVLSKEILENRGDTRKLYSIIRSLIGTNRNNPMPSGTEQMLANSFSDFFHEKILRIRNQLTDFPKYVPERRCIPPLHQFKEITMEEVKRCVMSAPQVL